MPQRGKKRGIEAQCYIIRCGFYDRRHVFVYMYVNSLSLALFSYNFFLNNEQTKRRKNQRYRMRLIERTSIFVEERS